MADQRTIARRLNLSTATVCRSLKNDPAIKPETRAKVTEMALKLGYQPKIVAAGARQKKQLLHIGALIQSGPPSRSNPPIVWNRVLWGASHAGNASNASIHLAYAPDPKVLADMSCWPPMLSDVAVSGLLLMGTFPDRVIDLLKLRFTCMQVVQHDPFGRLDCVDHDDLASVAILVRHLRELGHQQIGFASFGPLRQSYVQARFAGYVAAMAREGVTYDPRHVLNVYGQSLDCHGIAQQIAASARQGVSAWICEHDGVGYDVMRVLRDMGLRVPEDVSLCGFDDLEAPEGLPKLTTIDAPFEAMGMAAVQRLAYRVANPASEPIHLLFPCRLIQGQSTMRFAGLESFI